MSFQVIPRSAWGAIAPPNGQAAIPTPAPEVWIHHTVSATGPDEAQVMRQIQALHIRRHQTAGWRYPDIAYSFVVFPSGRVYEGRGFGIYGYHTQNHNWTGHGIALAGDYRTQSPTAVSLEACRSLIARGIEAGAVAGAYRLGGHRDVASTACPGDQLYARLDDLREVDVALSEDDKRWIQGQIAQAVIATVRAIGWGANTAGGPIPDDASWAGSLGAYNVAKAIEAAKGAGGGAGLSQADLVSAVKQALKEGTA